MNGLFIVWLVGAGIYLIALSMLVMITHTGEGVKLSHIAVGLLASALWPLTLAIQLGMLAWFAIQMKWWEGINR